jgi:MerR family copper efflux transcriptional regulator
MQGLSIGQLAKAANVSIDTIRFYEKSGLLPRATRRPSGFREYSQNDVRQLRFVRRARAVGFSLEEIAELLALEGEQDRTITARVIEAKLSAIDLRMRELQQWRRALRRLMRIKADRKPTALSISDFLEDESGLTASESPLEDEGQ